MKEVLFNYDNLSLEEIDETVIRVKALIINSDNEILLGYCHKTYQFPGGHLEDGESLEEGLIREIKEETGIELENKGLKPFEKITYYCRNYRESGKNRKNIIYYFAINTDKKADMNNTKLDDNEQDGNYIVKTIALKNFEQILLDSISDNPINKIIVEEMLEVIKEYKKITNN